MLPHSIRCASWHNTTWYLFEKNYEDWDSIPKRVMQTLATFLLANPANGCSCWRMTHATCLRCVAHVDVLQQFGSSMFIYRTPENLQYITEPFRRCR